MRKRMIITPLVVLMTTVSMVPARGQEMGNGFLLTGGVIYEQKVKLNIKLEGDAAPMAHALPTERKSQKVLHFTEEAALYENHQEAEQNEVMHSEGQATVMIRMVEPDHKIFLDLKKGIRVEQREFMSRIFLIESESERIGWKLTGRQQTLLDYPCQEAVAQVDSMEVQAWFTPGIPVPAGPAGYGNLPGLVLSVDINQGERVITALSVDLKPVDKDLLKKPSKGKKVSGDEFQAIVDEKMKEMGAEHGGGGNATFVVKIRE
jgi:GLPGLI family protein